MEVNYLKSNFLRSNDHQKSPPRGWRKSARTFCAAFFLMLFMNSNVTLAQLTVQIGFGTDTAASTLYSPCYRFSATSTTTACRSNIVFTAAEMASAGIPTGATITAVEFNKTNSANFITPANYTMWMANTSNVTLATTLTWASVLSTHTQVYTNSSFNVPLAPGWVPWNITPFVYTGGSLEIATEHTMVGNGGATDKFQWQYTTGFASQIVAVPSLGATLNGTTSGYKHRPNIKITFLNPTPCVSPPTPGTATSNAAGTICPGASVGLDLTGNSTGGGQTYQWQSSANIGGPYVNTGSSSLLASTTVNPTTSTYYRAAVTCSGNTQNSTPVLVNVSTGFPGGVYTINSAVATGGGNYQTFADAVNAIACGITGPIVFNVAPGSGPYAEQIIIPNIGGSSATNTIIFNGNGNTISFSATTTDERAVIKLNGADYITFDSLTIDGSGGTYGYGVQIMNNADHNTVKRCDIFSSTSSTSTTNYAGVLINSNAASITGTGNALCDSNTITGNRITGGYAGVSMVANGSTNIITGNTITNNNIKDFYLYGVYLNGGDRTKIEGNEFHRPLRTSVGGFNGIYLTGNSTNTLISKNRLHNPFDGEPTETSGAFAVYITGCDATAGNENIVSNNVIYNFIGGTGNQNGFLNVGSDYVKYYYNTVYMNDAGATCTTCGTRGWYMQTPLALGLEFRNNIIHIDRGGTGPKQAIYFEVSGIVFTADNNDYYISSTGGTIETGYVNGAGQATLAQWQTASGQDANSVAADPGLLISGKNVIPNSSLVDNIGAPLSITTDILNVTRNATNPDPGAFEFTAPPCLNSAAVLANNVTITTADINWDVVTGANGYEYEVSTSATPPASGTSTVDTFYNASGLSASTMYYAHVRTYCGLGNYSTWTTIQFTTDPCSDPAASAINITALSADITWNGIAGVTGYEYEVSNNATPPATGTMTTDTFYNATALSASTQYYAHVRTDCGGGNYSNWVTVPFTTGDCEAPVAVIANITGFTADITWNAVTDATNGYEYEVSQNSTPPASGTATSGTSHNATGLTMNTQYFVHLRSFCGGDTSSWSTDDFTTLDITSVNEWSKKTKFGVKAYPNPVKDVVTIVVNGNVQQGTLTLTDITGKVLRSITVNGNKAELDMRGMYSGVYFLNYRSNQYQETVRIIME